MMFGGIIDSDWLYESLEKKAYSNYVMITSLFSFNNPLLDFMAKITTI